jgi:uncharacterized membrane protein YedE/YeeE
VANRPLGALGGYVEVADAAAGRGKVGFRFYLLVGTVSGGALFAALTSTFRPPLAYAPVEALVGASPSVLLPVLLALGAVMGFGARWAGGCTSGHGLCGTGMGSPSSWVSTATFFAVAVGVANALALLGGGAR